MKQELKYIDETTKLNNRNYFIDKLLQYSDKNNTLTFGVNILVALDDVKEANNDIGYLKVDKFLEQIAKVFKINTNKINNSIIARMNGSEFCLFLPECSNKQALNIAKEIQNDIEILINKTNLNNSIKCYIGLYEYNKNDTVSKILSSSNNVLIKAKLNKSKIYQKSSSIINQNIHNLEETIIKAINLNNFYFISFKAIDFKHKKVLHNRLSLSLKGDDNIVYRYNQLIPIVEKLGLINTLYNNVLRTVFMTPDESLNGFICSLRLPYNYLVTDSTYENLKEILNTYKNNLPFELIIEIPNDFAYKYIEKTKLYTQLLKKYALSIGIYEFNFELTDLNYIKKIEPNYIKGDATYLISLDKKNLSTIKKITNNLNIDLIATDVKDKEILIELEKNEIYLIQGSIINSL